MAQGLFIGFTSDTLQALEQVLSLQRPWEFASGLHLSRVRFLGKKKRAVVAVAVEVVKPEIIVDGK